MSNKKSHHRHDKVFQHAMSEVKVARSMIENYLPTAISKHFGLDSDGKKLMDVMIECMLTYTNVSDDKALLEAV